MVLELEISSGGVVKTLSEVQRAVCPAAGTPATDTPPAAGNERRLVRFRIYSPERARSALVTRARYRALAHVDSSVLPLEAALRENP
jgi:hypothetical protein